MTYSPNKLNIALFGYGKMGKSIEKIALDKGHQIGLVVGRNNVSDLGANDLKGIDVAIEFTEPEAAYNNLRLLSTHGVNTISGTTGWLDHYEEIKSLYEEHNCGFMYASNFSIGVNLFFEINKYAARLMSRFPDYKIEIEEIHHTEKKDAPSGTAITLAQQIIDNHPSKSNWVNRETNNPTELNIISERKPKVKGTHIIQYNHKVDQIVLRHDAHSREGFAQGAVMAAEWIAVRNGVFSFGDMMTDMA